jgi:rsbT co-antagonist protein RsbR
VTDRLTRLASEREHWGCTPFEVAAAIICLKYARVPLLRVAYQDTPDVLASEITVVSRLVDTLGLVTLESVVKRREQIIAQQAQEILEISTPMIHAWEGVLVAPLIGVLDTDRAAQFTERLLERLMDTGAAVALVDITGVPAVDSRMAQHLIEAMTAVRLLGAEVVVTGVRPAVAQTLVHLGIDLATMVTRPSLKAGLAFALERLNLKVIRKDGSP